MTPGAAVRPHLEELLRSTLYEIADASTSGGWNSDSEHSDDEHAGIDMSGKCGSVGSNGSPR